MRPTNHGRGPLDEEDSEDALEETPIRITPVSMRAKVLVPFVLYLMMVLSVTCQSRSLIATSMVNTADYIGGFAIAMSGLFTNDILVYETYLISRDIAEGRYDWRELARILRDSPGVSKVSLSADIDMYYRPGPERTIDDIVIYLHDVSLPRWDRGPGIPIDEGRTIRKIDEVVVNRRLLAESGKGLGDEINLMGLNLEVVGISDVDISPPVPVALVDWSHIDAIVAHALQTAEIYNLTENHHGEWFRSSANLVVYAKGYWNVDKAVDAIVGVQEIMWGECG